MFKYLFGQHIYSPTHESWERVLQKGYAARLRPVCLCLPHGQGPELYIAQVKGQYVLKRMPYSGPLHAAHCAHYEPPPELSGLGQVTGSAIREDPETETTALMLDFPLSKGRARQPATGAEIEHESVRTDGSKLTMRGLLHYLFDEAGLSRWTPAMAGRRSWFIVRREILHAAASKAAKGRALTDVLFLPELFSVDRADEIRQRHHQCLAQLSASSSARMVLIGEVKAIEEARYGKALVIKHLPDHRLSLSEDLHRRLVARFADQLHLWAHLEKTHLMLIATISRTAQGIDCVEAACLMNVNEHWIPFETLYEWELLEALHRAHRRFTKGLRYNLPSRKPLASAVLQDTADKPTALFLISTGMESGYGELIASVENADRMQVWQWTPSVQSMTDFPIPTPLEADQARGQGWA